MADQILEKIFGLRGEGPGWSILTDALCSSSLFYFFLNIRIFYWFICCFYFIRFGVLIYSGNFIVRSFDRRIWRYKNSSITLFFNFGNRFSFSLSK